MDLNSAKYQNARQILMNKMGGYIHNSESKVDILFFLENGFLLRAEMKKEKEAINFVKNDLRLKRQYDLAFNEELRSKLRQGTGKWIYDEYKNEIKIRFAIGENIIRCKLKTNGFLAANNFIINNGSIIKKDVFEYTPSPEIFWWLNNMPNLNNNGKHFIIT